MNEPSITINGVPLTEAQAMTVRVAVQTFAMELQAIGCGDDEHGRRMASLYLLHIQAINHLMRERPEAITIDEAVRATFRQLKENEKLPLPPKEPKP